MNCSLPGSSIRGILQARIREWVAIPFSRRYSLLRGIFPTLGSNPGLLHCWQILYHLSHQESPKFKKKKSVYDIRKALVNRRLLVVKFWEIKSWSEASDCPGWGGELAPQFSYFLRVNCISFTPFIQHLLNERETSCFKHLRSIVKSEKKETKEKFLTAPDLRNSLYYWQKEDLNIEIKTINPHPAP